jgi:hypothetical protein
MMGCIVLTATAAGQGWTLVLRPEAARLLPTSQLTLVDLIQGF